MFSVDICLWTYGETNKKQTGEERGHDGGIAPALSKWGKRGQRCLFITES